MTVVTATHPALSTPTLRKLPDPMSGLSQVLGVPRAPSNPCLEQEIQSYPNFAGKQLEIQACRPRDGCQDRMLPPAEHLGTCRVMSCPVGLAQSRGLPQQALHGVWL